MCREECGGFNRIYAGYVWPQALLLPDLTGSIIPQKRRNSKCGGVIIRWISSCSGYGELMKTRTNSGLNPNNPVAPLADKQMGIAPPGIIERPFVALHVAIYLAAPVVHPLGAIVQAAYICASSLSSTSFPSISTSSYFTSSYFKCQIEYQM